MHIVTGSDNNYAAGVMVLIASAAWHTPNLRVTVLDMGISPDNRANLDALAGRLGIEIDRIEVSEASFSKLKVKRTHLNRSTYLRLLIPDLMPDETRVVYMDCDMVVMGNLTALNEIDLEDAIVAAVPCPSPNQLELQDTDTQLGEYVNAGLLVMNLPVWRAEGIAQKCLDLLSDPGRDLLSEDQSAINIVGRGRILNLPLTYNVYADPFAYAAGGTLPEGDIRVLHYVVRHKPWNSSPTASIAWRVHAAHIQDLMPEVVPVTLKKKLSHFNRRRRMWMGLMMRNPRYVAARKAELQLNQLSRKYAQSIGKL